MRYRINYSEVISKAGDISGQAAQLLEQVRRLSQIEQECRRVWKGDAADAFLNKLNQFHSEMDTAQKQLSNLASVIAYCAGRIQQEDQEQEQLALALSSGQ